MSTTFIQDILPTKDYAKINRIALEKSILFAHHHPTVIKKDILYTESLRC